MANGQSDADEMALLSSMREDASAFISSFTWAPPVAEIICYFGIGGVIAIYLFKFNSVIDGTDDQLWVVVGDLPSAYLVVGENDDPRQAAQRYCQLMEEWCDAVEKGSDLSDVYPVSVPKTIENSTLLRKRIFFILQELLMTIPDKLQTKDISP